MPVIDSPSSSFSTHFGLNEPDIHLIFYWHWMHYFELVFYCLVICSSKPNRYLFEAKLSCNIIFIRSKSEHVSLVYEVNFPDYFPPLHYFKQNKPINSFNHTLNIKFLLTIYHKYIFLLIGNDWTCFVHKILRSMIYQGLVVKPKPM